MKKNEKIAYLRNAHFALYVQTRETVFSELSDNQPMFCCCGKLASGLHERYCTKFNHTVDAETIHRLGYLLPKNVK